MVGSRRPNLRPRSLPRAPLAYHTTPAGKSPTPRGVGDLFTPREIEGPPATSGHSIGVDRRSARRPETPNAKRASGSRRKPAIVMVAGVRFVQEKKIRPLPWEREIPFKLGFERDLRPGKRPRPGLLRVVSDAKKAKVAGSNRGRTERAAVKRHPIPTCDHRKHPWPVFRSRNRTPQGGADRGVLSPWWRR